jgi:hypothetical protein
VADLDLDALDQVTLPASAQKSAQKGSSAGNTQSLLEDGYGDIERGRRDSVRDSILSNPSLLMMGQPEFGEHDFPPMHDDDAPASLHKDARQGSCGSFSTKQISSLLTCNSYIYLFLILINDFS